jgi:hypothetical protein
MRDLVVLLEEQGRRRTEKLATALVRGLICPCEHIVLSSPHMASAFSDRW